MCFSPEERNFLGVFFARRAKTRFFKYIFKSKKITLVLGSVFFLLLSLGKKFRRFAAILPLKNRKTCEYIN